MKTFQELKRSEILEIEAAVVRKVENYLSGIDVMKNLSKDISSENVVFLLLEMTEVDMGKINSLRSGFGSQFGLKILPKGKESVWLRIEGQLDSFIKLAKEEKDKLLRSSQQQQQTSSNSFNTRV